MPSFYGRIFSLDFGKNELLVIRRDSSELVRVKIPDDATVDKQSIIESNVIKIVLADGRTVTSQHTIEIH